MLASVGRLLGPVILTAVQGRVAQPEKAGRALGTCWRQLEREETGGAA